MQDQTGQLWHALVVVRGSHPPLLPFAFRLTAIISKAFPILLDAHHHGLCE